MGESNDRDSWPGDYMASRGYARDLVAYMNYWAWLGIAIVFAPWTLIAAVVYWLMS